MSKEKIGLKTVKTIDLTEIENGPVEVELVPLVKETILGFGLISTYVRFRVDGTKHNKKGHGRKRLIFYGSCSYDEKSEFYIGSDKIYSLEQTVVGLEGTSNGSLGDYLFGQIVEVGPGYYLEIPYETTKIRLESWRNGRGNKSLAYFTFLNCGIPSDLERRVLSLGLFKSRNGIGC